MPLDAELPLPEDAVAALVLDAARRNEVPAVLNHSLRYLHACLIGDQRGVAPGANYDPALLFYSCALHDIGTAEAYDGPSRFEVEGADAAAALLTEAGIGAAGVDQVWEAIALHTSPQIAKRAPRRGTGPRRVLKVVPSESPRW
jgi:HD superfamily phosphodiesterase